MVALLICKGEHLDVVTARKLACYGKIETIRQQNDRAGNHKSAARPNVIFSSWQGVRCAAFRNAQKQYIFRRESLGEWHGNLQSTKGCSCSYDHCHISEPRAAVSMAHSFKELMRRIRDMIRGIKKRSCLNKFLLCQPSQYMIQWLARAWVAVWINCAASFRI